MLRYFVRRVYKKYLGLIHGNGIKSIVTNVFSATSDKIRCNPLYLAVLAHDNNVNKRHCSGHAALITLMIAVIFRSRRMVTMCLETDQTRSPNSVRWSWSLLESHGCDKNSSVRYMAFVTHLYEAAVAWWRNGNAFWPCWTAKLYYIQWSSFCWRPWKTSHVRLVGKHNYGLAMTIQYMHWRWRVWWRHLISSHEIYYSIHCSHTIHPKTMNNSN